jgi:hypothetical protein
LPPRQPESSAARITKQAAAAASGIVALAVRELRRRRSRR